MDKSRAMRETSSRLRAALDARDWDAIADIAARLPQQLHAWSACGTLSATEYSALDELRRWHDQAQAICAEEMARLDGRMQDMRDRKEGWMAYAGSNEQEQG